MAGWPRRDCFDELKLSSELLDELFPVRSDPAGRRRRSRRAASFGDRPSPRQDGRDRRIAAPDPSADTLTTARPSQRRAVVVGVACAALALVVRLVLVHAFPVGDVARLPPDELGLAAVVVATVTWLCARAGVQVVVCLAVAGAAANLDVAAPLGIGFVLLAVLATKRR